MGARAVVATILVAASWLSFGPLVACGNSGGTGHAPIYTELPDSTAASSLCPFVQLRSDTVAQFLCWIGSIPASPPDPRLEPAIDAAKGDKKVLQSLLAKLDYGANTGDGDVVLLIIAQLQDPDALSALQRFIWLPINLEAGTDHLGAGPTDLEILQGNACRPLLCIGTQQAHAAYNDVLNNHPDWNVRAFALKTGSLQGLSGDSLAAACRFYQGV
jgi:hypothetical protein